MKRIWKSYKRNITFLLVVIAVVISGLLTAFTNEEELGNWIKSQ